MRLGVPRILFIVAPVLVTWWWFFPAESVDAWESGAPPSPWAHRREQEEDLADADPPIVTRWRYVPSHAMSMELKLAVLVAEDTGFFSHGAVDLGAVREAIEQWRSGRRLRGASTISQQLAKNLFLSADRSWLRKVNELRMAWWLERHLSKARIFELYLNIIELGPGVYGVDAASRYYYGVTASEVDGEQAASIAAAIPAPTVSNPQSNTKAYKRRRSAVSDRMHRLRFLRTVLEQFARR